MHDVSVVGTLVSPGQLEMFGHPIKVQGIPDECVGQRLEVTGRLMFKRDSYAYLKASTFHTTGDPDRNTVTVSGTVSGVLTPKPHTRYGKTACVLLHQTPSSTSKVLVTIPQHSFPLLDVSDLSIGEKLTVTGYLGYHTRGLHILFLRKEDGDSE